MPWRLLVAQRAARGLARLDRRDRQAIAEALNLLIEDFGQADIRKLRGRTDEWRLRVGRFRVILNLDNRQGLATVERVLPRERAYRR